MIYRWLALGLALAGMAVWLLWADRHRQRWRYAVGPLSWLLNVLLFYVFYFTARAMGTFDPLTINSWALVIQYHGLFLTLGGGIILLKYAKAGKLFDVT
jgi:hypothetical protein